MATTTNSIYVRATGEGKPDDVVLVTRTEDGEQSSSTTKTLGVVLEQQPGVFSAMLSGVTIEGCDSIKATSVADVATKLNEAFCAGQVQYAGATLAAPPSVPDAALPEQPPAQA
ncbi:hypothetical protein [Azospirillum sp. TSO22-1]|uniref:hypothetical protein n=1 Tax=Azospirillum sp. TSO22-1 TaxID=716789 RepID=UPI000D61C899|nr:hypothetical protein [Azospirillum sp. TSO22-1]PWC38373.1 hypothetical protein TSO221_27035 [Azospirillum sp. TSO22-1]